MSADGPDLSNFELSFLSGQTGLKQPPLTWNRKKAFLGGDFSGVQLLVIRLTLDETRR